MNSVNSMPAANMTPAAAPNGGAQQQEIAGAGGFAAVLQQLVDGSPMAEGQLDEAMALLLPVVPETDEELEPALELAAEMLMPNVPMQEQLPVIVDGQPAEQAAVTAVYVAAANVQAGQPVPNTQQESGTKATAAPLMEQAQQQGEAPQEQQVEVIGYVSASTEESGLQSQGRFYGSIAEAKQQLETEQTTDRKEDSKEVFDLEQLQQEVDTGKYNPTVERQKINSAQHLNRANVMQQVKSGIQQGLKLGKDAFVIKLRPEGLGEITVKLVEEDNKISLSILTSNAHVARLLDNDIAELRNALRPFNADVHEIVEQQADAQQGQNHNLPGQEQHQQNQQEQHSENSRQQAAVWAASFDTLIADMEQELAALQQTQTL